MSYDSGARWQANEASRLARIAISNGDSLENSFSKALLRIEQLEAEVSPLRGIIDPQVLDKPVVLPMKKEK